MILRKLLAIAIVTVMTATVFSVISITGRAEMGPVDAYGYCWLDSNAPDPTVPFDWIDISGTGTDTGIDGDDDYGGPFPIGFDFSYYGNTYGMFNASSNGFIMFDGSGYYLFNYEIPNIFNPNNIVAIYWDDLYVDHTYNLASIRYETIGLAPERQLVVEFENICELGSSDLMTFEIILNETGEIWFQYGPMNGNMASDATVGIENDDGTMGSEYSYYSDSLSDDLAIRFSAVDFFIGPEQESEVIPGDYIEYLLTVTNDGLATDSFDITCLSSADWVIERLDAILNPLGDDNLNGIPDTGDIAPGSSVDIIIRVNVPGTPASFEDTTTVFATSYETSSIASVSLTTTVLEAVFAPPHSDFVNDTDIDGLFDTLSFNVSLEVYIPGAYGIDAVLSIPPYDHVASAGAWAELEAGPHIFRPSFDARIINSYEIDGPYTVEFLLYSSATGNLSTDSYITSAYSWTQFDPPEIRFNTPFADYGYDSNGDTLFEDLVLEATVDVILEGDYEMHASLWDVYDSHVDWLTNYTHLTVGTHVVEFRYDGSEIWHDYRDGPFEVYLYAYNDALIRLDQYEYTTTSYTYDEFQPSGTLSPPYSDYGYDDNANGLFDYLVVEVPVDVSVGDIYLFDADLSDAGMAVVDYYSGYVSLDAGAQVVELWFDGEILRANGVDGNYTVDFFFMDDTYRYIDGDSYETDWYGYNEFEGSARIIPPHTEYTIDADSDGLYDSFVITIDLEVSTAGYYLLYVFLYDSYGTIITYVSNIAYFAIGFASIDAIFAGFVFQSGGFDGPYEAYAELTDPYAGTTIDEYGFFTESYAHDDFETPSELTPPHTDHGYDANDDGFYDYLVIEATVNITSAGEYTIEGWLWDEWGSFVCIASDTASLDPGVQTFDLRCDGQSIHDSGLNGPYTVDLYLEYEGWGYTDFEEYVTGSYTYDEFQPPPSYFSTTFWDFPVDATDDGLYEYLVVVATVEVTVSGEYTVSADMYDPYWYYVQWTENTSYLEAGIQEVELWFYGPGIRASERDGYYRVDMSLYDAEMDALDDHLYYTASYSWDEFQSAALFSPPHSDHGYDENDDSIYEYLVIEVNIEVFMSDELSVRVYLFDEYWNTIAYVETTQYCEEGFVVISVYIPGWDILENGIDGPYYADLYLYHDGDLIESGYYTTSDYAFNEFSQIPAQFGAPHSDYGYDDDGDLLYEYLVVEVRVNVTIEGTYLIQAELRSFTFVSIDSVLVEATLSEGMQTVEVMFDSWLIAAHDIDGPYEVRLNLFMDDLTFLDYETYETESYLASEFDPAVPMIYSYWASEEPTIDGVYSAGEWEDATCVSFVLVDPLSGLDLVMLVLNNGTHLFVCYDFVGDLTEDDNDGAIVCLDTGNDGILTPEHEDRFIIMGEGSQVHQTYEFYSTWSTHCSPFDPLLPYHDGLWAAAGFGSSDQLADDHRVYEFCIPLDLILASAGDILGFAGAALDRSTETYGYWPLIDEMLSTPSLYGDLVLYSSAPPATTLDLSGTEGSSGWYTSAVEFTLTSEDDDEGVNYTRYRLDGGEWSDYTSAVTVSAEGSHALEFYSVDLAGNAENIQSASINIDMTAPEATAAPSGTLGENGWYRSDVTISLQGDDGTIGSGIANFTIRIDGGPWVDYASSLSISEDGVFLLEYYCTDVAGISADIQELTVKVDATAPETTASVDGSTVTLSATDPTSGVLMTKYRVDGGEWMNYAVPFEVPGSGNHTVEFYSIDNAGNAGDISLQLLDNGSGGTTVFGVDLWTLIIVLLILAIIVGISIPLIYGMRRKAKVSDAKAVMKDAVSPIAQLYDEPSPPPPPADETPPPKKD
ncbi:MAG: hypothetical protein KKE24_01775 [Candidatus Thermoplasmatota archaeon]|nr:hypothetical protein [Candidatus Thermoplasmatota archaeon]